MECDLTSLCVCVGIWLVKAALLPMWWTLLSDTFLTILNGAKSKDEESRINQLPRSILGKDNVEIVKGRESGRLNRFCIRLTNCVRSLYYWARLLFSATPWCVNGIFWEADQWGHQPVGPQSSSKMCARDWNDVEDSDDVELPSSSLANLLTLLLKR